MTSSIRRWFTGVGASMVLWPAIAEAQVMTRSSDGLRNNQSFAPSQVSAAQKKDGLANGALIGAAVGAGAALSILAIAGSGEGYVLPSAKVGAPLLLFRVSVPLSERWSIVLTRAADFPMYCPGRHQGS